MQNKKHSFIEAISNTVIGLLFSFTIQTIVYPMLGLDVSVKQNLTITGVFFIASIIRSYLLRRVFTRLFNKK